MRQLQVQLQNLEAAPPGYFEAPSVHFERILSCHCFGCLGFLAGLWLPAAQGRLEQQSVPADRFGAVLEAEAMVSACRTLVQPFG